MITGPPPKIYELPEILLIFGNHEDGTRQLHTAYCPPAPCWDQYCAILGLFAVSVGYSA